MYSKFSKAVKISNLFSQQILTKIFVCGVCMKSLKIDRYLSFESNRMYFVTGRFEQGAGCVGISSATAGSLSQGLGQLSLEAGFSWVWWFAR